MCMPAQFGVLKLFVSFFRPLFVVFVSFSGCGFVVVCLFFGGGGCFFFLMFVVLFFRFWVGKDRNALKKKSNQLIVYVH